MIVLAWSVFAFLALLWTAGAWLGTLLVQWGLAVLGTSQLPQVGYEAADWPLPAWIGIVVDTAWIESLQAALRWAFEVAGPLLVAAGGALGWLVPLIWTVWALGFLLLLALAVLAHVLVRRHSRSDFVVAR